MPYRRPMTEDEQLAFITALLEPGQPTMGLWFGWSQPPELDLSLDDPSFEVKLGTAVATLDGQLTLRQLLAGSELGYETARYIIKERGKTIDNPLDAPLAAVDHPSRYWGGPTIVAEEVFCDFFELEPAEQLLYRLKVAVINTMTDGHNWAIEWGDYIAAEYFSNSSTNLQGCYVLDDHGDWYWLQELLYWGDSVPVLQNELRVSPEYYDPEPPKGSATLIDKYLDWENSLWDMPPFSTVPASDYRFESIVHVLTWIMQWVAGLWLDGTLELDPSTCPPELETLARQMALPGI